MARLAGKVAIITGGGSGFGREMALRFVAEGASVLAADVNEAGAKETVAAMGDQAAEHGLALRMDVTSEDDCAAVVKAAVERWGRLDVMIANAGIGVRGTIAKLAREDWQRVLDVNLTGVFLCAKHAFTAMQDHGGVILATSSVAGLHGTPGLGAYGVSKAGVVQLVQTLALEGARYNIRANALCPVWAQTALVDQLAASTRDPEKAREAFTAAVPLGRLGTPADIASAAVYLASDEASFITGIAFPIDGGHMASR